MLSEDLHSLASRVAMLEASVRRLSDERDALRSAMVEIAARDYRGPKPFEIELAQRAIGAADRAREAI